MRGGRGRWALAVAAVGLVLVACGPESSSDTSSGDPAATLEEVEAPDGTELHQVTLAQSAIARLGIELAPITELGGELVVPYAAIVYDPEGGTWVYTQPGPRSFLRERVTVRVIAGDEVFLTRGPKAGTDVVTVATPELYGAEQEIGA
jgi:hypothetical protein